jgi:hypothetical protein
MNFTSSPTPPALRGGVIGAGIVDPISATGLVIGLSILNRSDDIGLIIRGFAERAIKAIRKLTETTEAKCNVGETQVKCLGRFPGGLNVIDCLNRKIGPYSLFIYQTPNNNSSKAEQLASLIYGEGPRLIRVIDKCEKQKEIIDSIKKTSKAKIRAEEENKVLKSEKETLKTENKKLKSKLNSTEYELNSTKGSVN